MRVVFDRDLEERRNLCAARCDQTGNETSANLPESAGCARSTAAALHELKMPYARRKQGYCFAVRRGWLEAGSIGGCGLAHRLARRNDLAGMTRRSASHQISERSPATNAPHRERQ